VSAALGAPVAGVALLHALIHLLAHVLFELGVLLFLVVVQRPLDLFVALFKDALQFLSPLSRTHRGVCLHAASCSWRSTMIG
jgi:hypothetical protein